MNSGGVLAAQGLQTRQDAPLTWALLGGGTLLFVAVMALLAWAVLGAPRPTRGRWWLLGGGLLLPAVVLVPLALLGLRQLAAQFTPPPADALLVGVSARAWWWQLRVPGPDGGAEIVMANELVLPVGRPVRLALSSQSLIHSLWVPELAGKVDLIPGRVQHLLLQAEFAGRWRGPCAEFCGTGHTQMVLQVVALPSDEYAAWLRAQARAAQAPSTQRQERGLQHFLALRCGACHTVRGVVDSVLGGDGAAGDSGGPDLTHLASRQWLGAGTVANDAAGRRAWLRDAARLKPGARMPSYDHLDQDTLDALVDYLGQLR